MNENELNQQNSPESEEPVQEPKTIQLSTQTPLVLENPLTQMQLTDPATFSTLHEKIGTMLDGTFTVSLDEVEAHPFAKAAALAETLPPALLTPQDFAQEKEPGLPEVSQAPVVLPQEHQPAKAPAPAQEKTSAAAPTPAEAVSPAQPGIAKEFKKVKEPEKAQPEKKSEKQALPPRTPDTPPEKPQKRKRRWWPWILVAVLVVFLGTIGGFVPVENIPILRSIAHAMGFTPDEAKQMSFLRALLTWTDRTLGLNGRLSAGPQVNGSSLFSGRMGEGSSAMSEEEKRAAELQGKMARYTGRSNLIDMRALNELQRQKGRQTDQIIGSVLLLPGQKPQTRAAMRDAEVTVRTEANRDKGDVYFGSDASAINREFNDGYDSIKTLAKVANPHIIDGQPIDWLQQMTARMMRVDTGLVGIDKELGNSVVGWKTDPGTVRGEKPVRDLYHAWITSRMSNYTTSVMLKKTLADASFLGAAIPTQASDSLVFGGVRVDADSLESDQEGWKEYLEFERKCKEELMDPGHGGVMVQDAVNEFNSLFEETNLSGNPTPANANFPSSCKEALGVSYGDSKFYHKTVSMIRKNCKQMAEGYKRLESTCKMKVDYTTNRCDSNKEVGNVEKYYEGRYVDFQNYCEKRYCDEQEEAYKNAHSGSTEGFSCNKDGLTGDSWANSGNYKDEDAGCFGISTAEQIKKDVGGDSDYFPQITKDQAYEDAEHRVRGTIEGGIKQNKTL